MSPWTGWKQVAGAALQLKTAWARQLQFCIPLGLARAQVPDSCGLLPVQTPPLPSPPGHSRLDE